MSDFTCFNCPDREVGCHGKCEKYQKELIEHKRKKDIQERENISRNYTVGVMDRYLNYEAKKPKLKYSKKR